METVSGPHANTPDWEVRGRKQWSWVIVMHFIIRKDRDQTHLRVQIERPCLDRGIGLEWEGQPPKRESEEASAGEALGDAWAFSAGMVPDRRGEGPFLDKGPRDEEPRPWVSSSDFPPWGTGIGGSFQGNGYDDVIGQGLWAVTQL